MEMIHFFNMLVLRKISSVLYNNLKFNYTSGVLFHLGGKMRLFLSVFLSLQILFGVLPASEDVWEYLLGDLDFCNKAKGAKTQEEPNLALMTLEAPPVSMVAGCVSVISGAFVDTQIGLVVPGALPLTVQSTYCSSEKKWSFKYKPELRAELSSGGNHINIGYIDEHGSGIPFRESSSKKTISFLIPSTLFEKGLTNCGSGQISGKTNLKNNKLHFVRNEHGKCYQLQTPSHKQQLFTYVKGGEKHRQGAPLGKFRLEEELLPSGNKIKYSYSEEDKLIKVSALAGNLEIEELIPSKVTWKSSAGSVSYIFDLDQKRVNRIEPSNALPASYEYNYDHRISKKNLPEGRFLFIAYHDLVDNWRKKPVRYLAAPVGETSDPVYIYTFTYGKDSKAGVHTTTVEDAVGNKTVYSYKDQDKRLTSIKKYQGDKIYTKDCFVWSVAGNLKARYFQGENHNYFSRTYDYDNYGNVIEERLYGNLTGKTPSSLQLKSDGRSKDGEVFIKTRTFSQDGWNLLLTEDDGRKTIQCSYYPSSNLLKTRFTLDGAQIIKREFFEYSNGVLVKEVWDDNGTQMHEKRVTLTSNGLPKVVAEYCNNRLVKKHVNIYSPQGLITSQAHYGSDNCLAYTLYWEYDALGNITKEINALGEEHCYSYDANGNKIEEQGPELSKKYTYDLANRLTKEEEFWNDGRHLTTRHRYNTLNQRIVTNDIYRANTYFTYDVLGRLIEKQLPHVEDENGNFVAPVEKTEYDPMGNIVAKWDAMGNCTKRKCTIRGAPYHIEYPDGSVEEKYYTLDGLLECEIAKNGLIKTYSYDALGRVIKTETKDRAGALLKTTSATYNTFHLISETDELGNTTTYTYDWAGRLASKTIGDHVTYYKYDALGRNIETKNHTRTTIKKYDLLNRIIEEDEILQKTEYRYDVQGNRTHQICHTHAGPAITKTSYLPNGEPLTITDPLGNVTHVNNDYAYRRLAQRVRCTTTTDPLGNQEIKIYDSHQRLIQQLSQNALGKVTQNQSYTYDLAGRKVAMRAMVFSEKEPYFILTNWQYDCMGNITSCIEAKGAKEQKTTRYHYNLFGQKERTELPNGVTLSYTYDVIGLLKTYSSSDGTISYSYSYDAKDRPIQIVDHVQGTISTREYDLYGRLISETLDTGLTITNAYDALDRLTCITLPDQTTIEYQYNALYLTAVKRGEYTHYYDHYDLAGNASLEHLAGQAGTIEYAYDLLQRPISINSPYRHESLLEFDPTGNLLQRQVNSLINSYAYDDLYQLTSETGLHHHLYTYDSLYNRRSKDNNSYTINKLNQLLQEQEWDYHYDLNGNLMRKTNGIETVEYRYDALDRLIEVKNGSNLTTYTYDSFHRRLSKTHNGQTTHFLYHGQNEIGALSNGLINQLRVLGTSHGAEIGSAVLLELQGQVFIPIHDVFGNIITLLDPSGNLIESYDYSAFGETAFTHSKSPWLFSSKRLDPETGLFFFGRRYYAPDTGRWITPDPLGFEDGPNLYTYVHNRPLVFIDPDGQFAFLAPIAYFAITTAIGMAAEAALPYAVGYCGETAAGVACAAFITGAVKGYNGSLFEGNSFDGAGWEASAFEYGGKAVGSAFGFINPRGAVKFGYKMVANMATKEVIIGAEKLVAKEVAPMVVSTLTRKQTKNMIMESGEAVVKGARNRFRPDAIAEGAHSVFRKDPLTNRITKYETFIPQTNPKNPCPWESLKRFDNTGKINQSHYNKVLKVEVFEPHVHDPLFSGGIRPAYPWEIPK